jgi:hypothetical protein
VSKEGKETSFFNLARALADIKEFIESHEKRKCKRVLEDIKHLAQEALEHEDPNIVKAYIKGILKEIERYEK